jgi:hypothetical protein
MEGKLQLTSTMDRLIIVDRATREVSSVERLSFQNRTAIQQTLIGAFWPYATFR